MKSAAAAGYSRSQVRQAFPGKLDDVLDYFAIWTDSKMMEKLDKIDPEVLRVRDRIRTAVLARFDSLEPYREAERQALSYWSMPLRHIRAAKIVWRTADTIWDWAGDTAKDYNRYTKRGLLSGILSTTLLVWLDDDSQGRSITRSFLDRRIENVMQFGQIVGKIKSGSFKKATQA